MNRALSRTLNRLLSSSYKTLELLFGAWKSSVLGQGLEVEEIRPFSPGDNPLAAVWSRFAQTGTLYSKLFHEERERTVYIAFDRSGSLFQGAGRSVPFGEELFSLIALSAIVSRDSVGAIFNRQNHIQVVRPKSSQLQLELLLQEIAIKDPFPITSSLASFFTKEKEAHGLKRSLLLYISDFVDPNTHWETLFLSLSLRHEVLLLRLCDEQNEKDLFSAVGCPCFDPEKSPLSFQTLSRSLYQSRQRLLDDQSKKVNKAASSLRIPLFSFDVNKNCAMQLIDALVQRRSQR